jgi:putative ABC transport system permease protein
MAIVGVTGCAALMLCAFGMQDSLDEFSVWNFNDINRYESEIVLSKAATQEQTDKLINDYHGEAIMENTIEVKANGVKKTGELLVTDQVTLIRNFSAESKPITLPKDGISISYRMAEILKVSVGDEISWHIYGVEEWHSSKIEAIFRKPISQGISISRECFEDFGYHFQPTSIVTLERVPAELKGEAIGVTKVWAKEDLIASYNTMTEAMDVLFYVLILAAIVLAVVVLYNLGVLSFLERQRELSTLKVIGFKTGRIRALLFTQNLWMTALGILFGIPIGLWILDYIFQFLGDSFDFIIVVKVSSYLYSLLGTFLVSILVNRLFSRRVKKLDMVSSLKGVE